MRPPRHISRLRLQPMKGESVDRACTTALVFRMAREERRHAIFPGRRGATIAEAERFAREAEMARTGRLPEPKPADGSAMTKTRARLLSALASPAKERSPVFASLAFARYDAWDERQRAWPNGEEAQGFRRDVEETLTVLEGLCAQGG